MPQSPSVRAVQALAVEQASIEHMRQVGLGGLGQLREQRAGATSVTVSRLLGPSGFARATGQKRCGGLLQTI